MVNGRSLAEAEAVALSTEYKKVIADIKVCNNCMETALLVAEEFDTITLRATASAQVKLQGAATPGTPVRETVNEFVSAFSEAFIFDFSKVPLMPSSTRNAGLAVASSVCGVDVPVTNSWQCAHSLRLLRIPRARRRPRGRRSCVIIFRRCVDGRT